MLPPTPAQVPLSSAWPALKDGLWGHWTEVPAPASMLTDGRGDRKREEAVVRAQVVGKEQHT